MKKVIFTLFFALFLYGASQAKNNNVIEAELQNILTQRSDDMIDISIIFKSQVNTSKLMAKSERRDLTFRRDFVVSELREFSEQTQSDILALLQAEEKNGNVSNINSLWIVNAINCKASRDVIYRLASHPDIEVLTHNPDVQLISKEEMEEIEYLTTRALPVSHIVSVNADHVWEQGYTGKNVVVAILDSGTNEKHHDIKNNLWEGLKDIDGDGVEDIINGWNFINDNAVITDDYGHGTHCAGIICGDGTSGQITGVAPDAKLMTLKTVGRAGSGTVAQMLSGVQFAVENGADILSMSLGFKHYQTSVAQREEIRNAFDNVLAAGVIVCAAAGNDGNIYGAPNNIDYPAACPSPWRNPDQTLEGGLSSVVCVGAYDLGMSSRGPSSWEGTSYNDYAYNDGAEMGLIRPDICAPGNLIYSLNSSIVNKYNQKSGTSQATPCVAGVMALMLEKNSALTPAQITEIIETTASNKPVTKNNSIGAGRIDALAAVNAVTEGTRQPYLVLQSYTPSETSPGDKTISITLKNEGKGSCLTSTEGTILIDDNYITINEDEATQTIGQVSTGYTKTLNYNITIDEQTPNGHITNCTYVITSGEYIWKYPFSITISQTPNIVFKSVTPGTVDVNQDIDISVTMHNIGTADMPNNTKLTLSTLPSNAQYITIINDETTVGSMNVGESASGTFTIRVSDNTPHTRAIELFLEVESEFSTTSSFTYEFENDNEGWTSFDAANNGIATPWWHNTDDIVHGKTAVKSFSGNGHLMSETMMTNNGQQFYANPIDNYLVSPEKIKITDNSKITFHACANHTSYYKEHFGVAVSTGNNNSATDFTTIQEWTIGEDQKTTWEEYTVDLSAYKGQEIYVAIHHFFTQSQWSDVDNGFKVDALNIDNITLHEVAMDLHHIPTYSDDDPNYFTIVVNNQLDLPMPANLSASANGTDKIDLMWNAVDGAKGYNVYRNGVRIANNITDIYYRDKNLEHNTEYCYEVAAVYLQTEFERASACATTDQKNYSVALLDYSPKTIYMGVNDSDITFTLVIDGSTRLPAKGWVSLTSNDPYFNNTTKPSIELTTSVIDPNDESTYTVNIGIDPNIPNRHVLDFNINVISAGTQAGEEYEFNLPFSILVKNDPNIPRNLKTDSISGNSISLSWEAVTGAVFYNIYRDGEFLGSTASTTYFDCGLESETTYCYEVTSITDDGESDTSEKVCATTLERKNKILLQSFVLEDPIGETTLTTTLINKGYTATPTATTATLKSNDPYVDIITETVNVGSIAVDGTVTAVFTIRIDNAVPLNHDIHFDLITEFENEEQIDIEYTFDNDFEGWTNYIYSEKKYVWEYDATNKLIKSASRKNNENLLPDNFICSPSKIKATADTRIVYDVKPLLSDCYAEHYAIYYSEVDPVYEYGWELNNLKNVYETTLTQDYAGKWTTESIDLSSAKNKDIWVAFRHFGCTGQSYIMIDNIEILNVMFSGLFSYKNSFFVTVNPSINIFTGTGLWSDASRWNKRHVPTTTEDAIINGDATIENGDITVNSLVVNKHLTINSGINLTVSNIFYNANPDNIIINDDVQIFHNSTHLAATYRMNIARPQSWEADHKGGWQFITSPVKGASVYDFAPEVADYDLFKYDGTQELEWLNLKNHATDFESTFQQGRGYIVSYEAQTTADFKGLLYNGKTFTFTDIKAKDDSKHVYNFYLLGNPFSFNMNWNEVTATDVYNGYATINSVDGSYDYHTDGTINVGDGFFVISTGPAASLTYGATRKAHKEKCHSLNVVSSNFYGLDNVIINLDGNSDYGFKKLNNINADISDIYISNSDERYGIFSFDDNTNEVPVSFKATKTGEHRISIDAEGEFEYITLVDKFTGIETDMLKNSYSFKVLSTGGDRERFTVKFSKKTKDASENFVYQSGNELIINAEGQVQIIDVMGRIVYSNEINGDDRINIGHLNKAAYIIRLTNEDENKTQKIVVY